MSPSEEAAMLPAQKGKRKQTSRGKESADASSKRRRQKLTLIPRSSRKAASRAAATAADGGGKNTGEGKEESPAVDDKVCALRIFIMQFQQELRKASCSEI